VLEQKLSQIADLGRSLEQKREKKHERESFTKNGGLFAAQEPSRTPAELVQGSHEWIIDRRNFIEGLLEHLASCNEELHDAEFVRTPVRLEDILLDLESTLFKSDDELANRLFTCFSNQILSSDDPDAANLFTRLVKLSNIKLQQF